MNRNKLTAFLSIILALAPYAAATLVAEAGISTAEAAPTTGTLEVKVNVSDANVYLDGGIVGTGSFAVDNISPGLHRLTVVKDGYYPQSLTVRVIAGETTKASVNLVPMTGTVEITGIPDNTVFSVKIGDREYASKRIEVAEGHRDVTIRAFGYRDQTLLADVRGRHTTVIEFKAEPAPFEAGGLTITRRSFNPDNPALLGCAELSFTVSAPGTGRVELRDGTGATVKTIVLAPFTTWKQRVVWDGTGNDGAALPDGVYPLSVSVASAAQAASAEGQTTLELASNATIDRSIEYPILGTDPGVGATGPVVSAAFLPARAVRFNADASAFGGSYGAGMSLAAGFAGWLETGARFAAVTDGGEESALDVSCGIKAGKRLGELRTAAALNWRARTEYVSERAGKDRNGIGLALPLEYRAGRVSLGITPSIAFGDGLGFMNGPYFTAGAGAAARADLGNVFLAAFGAADSVAFGGAGGGDDKADAAVLGPIGAWSAGASARVMLPSTSVMLSLEGGYAKPAGERGGAYASGGIGIAF